jgi:hypothetical protein
VCCYLVLQAIVYPKKMLDTKFVCRTSIAADTWRVSTPLVFPQLPDNVDDPSLYQNALQAHRAAPLAALAGNDQQLQVWCEGPRDGWVAGAAAACGHKEQRRWQGLTSSCRSGVRGLGVVGWVGGWVGGWCCRSSRPSRAAPLAGID